MSDDRHLDFRALFDEVSERYSIAREKAARALIDYANIRKTSSGPPYVEPLDPAARKMADRFEETLAEQRAAIARDANICAGCGHSRVFHQIGTGNGVPLGQEFCDDRHAPPCDCRGFKERQMAAECDHRYCDADGNRVYLHCQRCGARDPLEPDLRATGTWRVYFHRLNPDGLPWCVAPASGTWEIAVANVAIDAPSSTVYAPKSTPDDEDGRPSAWIAVTGVLTVSADGRARIGAA